MVHWAAFAGPPLDLGFQTFAMWARGLPREVGWLCMGVLRSLIRESRLARAGAWCAVACVPGLVYCAGSPVFGYAISAAPAVGWALLLPLGAGAALSSGLVAAAAFRSGYALAHSNTPEPPPQPLAAPSLGLRDNPILGLVVALVFVVFAASDFRWPAPSPVGSRWFFLAGGALVLGICCQCAVWFRTARRREQAMIWIFAASVAAGALRWRSGAAWMEVALAALALWEARDGFRLRGGGVG